MSVRWLVTGAQGMLGQDLVQALRSAGREVTGVSRHELDITDLISVHAAVRHYDIVVNAAAWTDVDGAEASPRAAHRVNALGTAYLASACEAIGARLVYPSTDYVFPGTASSPYAEDTPTEPINVYGRTKRDGEIAVRKRLPATALVVRTSWLYGVHGRNFPATIAQLATSREYIDVVNDQRGQPTWSRDLAHRIVQLVDAEAPGGIYHASNAGETTWYELARAVFERIGHDPERVRPVGADAYLRAAARPAYSVLADTASATVGLGPMRPWEEAFSAAADELFDHPAKPS